MFELANLFFPWNRQQLNTLRTSWLYSWNKLIPYFFRKFRFILWWKEMTADWQLRMTDFKRRISANIFLGHCWRSRDELIRDVLLWTPTHGCAKAGRPARTYIQQLCEDTGCCPEDLPRAMNDREEWRERVRDIRATSTTWWWWSAKRFHVFIIIDINQKSF